MNLKCVGVQAVVIMAFVAAQGQAMPFDPAFRLASFDGTCMVSPPNSGTYAPAELGKAYPYGTLVKTGPASRALINITLQSTIDLGPEGEARVDDFGTRRVPGVKGVELYQGKIDVQLERDFNKENGFIVLTHCFELTATSGPTVDEGVPADAANLKFSVVSSSAEGMRALLAAVLQGEIRIVGPHFEIPAMLKDDKVSAACTLDREFLRIRGEGGKFGVQVADSTGNPRTTELVPGAIIRILQQPSTSGDATVVTVLEIDPNNQPVRADSYKTDPQADTLLKATPETTAATAAAPAPDPAAPEGSEEELAPPPDAPDTKPAPDQAGRRDSQPDWDVIEEITTVTTTTTTSTIPPGFQPGRRPPAATTTTTIPPRRPTTTITTTPNITTTTKPEGTPVGNF